jgi:TolB-like protein/Tfp pilus assembly protein PilF
MSLLAELQRRKVFRVAAAYAVVGWLVIQVASTVLPQFDMPDWAPRLVTLLIALGFPVALVMAWVFDVTPGGLKVDASRTGTKRMIAAAVVLAGAALAWYFVGAPAVREYNTAQRSIAVLPFVNMSGDPQNEYFSDGISEEILNVLAGVPQLAVAARTSSFQYKGGNRDVAQIARELKVRMVLEGSVRKQANRVRITAQLIDASTGYHVWSKTYDRELKDVFAIQDEIARAIGAELKVRVMGEGAPVGSVSGTTNLAAHDQYLRGLALWQQRDQNALWDAEAAMKKALDADPKFAQAWAGLALVYSVLPDYSSRISYADAFAKAREAAERALVIDASLPEAYAAPGNVETTSGHGATGVALLERAIALRPSFATAHQWLGNTLILNGDPERAVVELRRAALLDPRSLIVANNLAAVLLELGRYDEAIQACSPTLKFAPKSFLCPQVIALAHLLAGRPAQARVYFERWAALSGVSDRQVVALYDVLEGKAERKPFVEALAATPERAWLDPKNDLLLTNFEIVVVLMLLEQPAQAQDYIERNTVEYPAGFGAALLIPVFDPIRCEPRFVAAAAKLKLVDVRARKRCPAGAGAKARP